eukprot:TRINITY_DN62069_c0_g1_i1.p2 TRINITY_DN62069_c0_g1~~TRINITY_DN62069_c0_g1_i1.p2  ORF type:complete len:442 (+),score=36.38 TRINITY_DN62069_c0_g1_i1:38-1363(+)
MNGEDVRHVQQVSISGAILSALLYSFSSTDDVEGLLLGTQTVLNRSRKGDHDQPTIEWTMDVYEITAYVVLGSVMTFYDTHGKIKPEAIQPHVKKKGSKEKLLGWFRFRRNTMNSLGVRENAVCKSLSDFMENPLFGLITQTTSPKRDTHSWNSTFFLHEGHGSPTEIDCTIVNLMTGSQQEYMDYEHLSPSCLSSPISNEMTPQLLSTTNTLVAQTNLYFQSTLQQLNSLAEEACSSENEVRAARHRIAMLKRKVHQANQQRQQRKLQTVQQNEKQMPNAMANTITEREVASSPIRQPDTLHDNLGTRVAETNAKGYSGETTTTTTTTTTSPPKKWAPTACPASQPGNPPTNQNTNKHVNGVVKRKPSVDHHQTQGVHMGIHPPQLESFLQDDQKTQLEHPFPPPPEMSTNTAPSYPTAASPTFMAPPPSGPPPPQPSQG